MKELNEIETLNGECDYIGMVNRSGKPHGWGRAIIANNYCFIDGQWKDGVPHGYYRLIS